MNSSLKALISKNAKIKNISEFDSHVQISGLLVHCDLSMYEISQIVLLLNSETINKLLQQYQQYLRVGFLKTDLIEQAILNNLPELPKSRNRVRMFDYNDEAWHGMRVLKQAAEILSPSESLKKC
ncbi:MAG: hypothetical protein EBQ95_07340 [Gammaproteobacteria bacterium]|nr:hypothetical protein [Gammaproteobacteria bacterium]